MRIPTTWRWRSANPVEASFQSAVLEPFSAGIEHKQRTAKASA